MSKCLRHSVFTVLFLVWSGLAQAQLSTATLGGRVTDAGGAILPGAQVRITNEGTGVTVDEVANKDGLFTAPELRPGSYTVAVMAPNFRTELQNHIVLQIGQVLDLPIALMVGASSETVTVTAQEPLTDTATASVGTVIDNVKVVEIPLNGRQFYDLAVLVPGVVPSVRGSVLSTRGSFNVAGQNETSNYFVLDGFNNVDAGINAPSLRPSIDDIQEFKIFTGTFEAEFGHNIGGIVTVTTRSGGNQFHGNAYEFIRNQVADAKNYFTLPGVKPTLKRNQFGGTFGGPIMHDKAFFFFNYEGFRLRQQVVQNTGVPTPTLLSGNFTAAARLRVPFGYDPRVVQGNVINPQYLTASQLQAYTVGHALLAFYPVAPAGIYNFSAVTSENSNQYALRLDETINAKNTVFATLNYFNDPVTSPGNTLCPGPGVSGFGCVVGLTTQLYGGGWTRVFTPNVVNTVRAGYQRLNQPRTSLDANVNFDQQYGIPAFSDPTVPNNGGVPYTLIAGYASLGDPPNLPQNRRDNTYDATDTLIVNRGAHSFKAGAEYTRVLANSLLVATGRGAFNFQPYYTGNSLADAELGLPALAQQTPTAPGLHARNTYIAAFVQDTWKLTKNLTANYGLRWETFTPVTDGSNQLESFNRSTDTAYRAGTNGTPRHVYKAFNRAFAPRLGLNYQPFSDEATVVHAGFGVTYDAPIILNTFANNFISYPIRNAATFRGAPAGAPPLSLPNPFQGNPATSAATFGIDPNFQPPMNVAYSMGVQQQFGKAAVLDVTYQGSETAHITQSLNIQEGTPGGGPASLPYKGFASVGYILPVGHSSYNALYAKLEQRYQNGLSFLLSYTWSKSIDNQSYSVGIVINPQNVYNLSAERGLSGFDVRNRFVASPVYILPFGDGRSFLNKGVASKVFGGFELAANISLQDGTPVTPLLAANVSNTGSTTTADRPNVVGDPNNGPKTVAQWFNKAAFATPAAGTFGNARRNIINTPAFRNVDLNFSRRFHLYENANLQFRAEVFNILNHPNFGLPGNVVNSPTYGQITTASDGRDIQLALKLNF